jgi:hypothetical protein
MPAASFIQLTQVVLHVTRVQITVSMPAVHKRTTLETHSLVRDQFAINSLKTIQLHHPP